ncbi:MAG: tyrosine protein phosphatase [Desulfobacteraceae bacterium]|nr:MAG: tyrosine protein phosphatase [Desulfobacteraceae bacterium]
MMTGPMIDVHCHILPGMDDGPSDLHESLEMAEIASKGGIRQIIATPHVSGGKYSPQDISQRTDQFNRLLKQNRISVQVYPGAEVSVSLDPILFPKYTLNNTNYILLEFPHGHLPSYAGKLLLWLCSKGLKPVIAHPERNYSVIRSPEILLKLLNNNIYVQITAASITGDFGVDIKYCADFLLDSGKVDLIASDAHSMQFRTPAISEAVAVAAKKIGNRAAQRLVSTNPAALLAGEEIHSNVDR